MRRRSGRVRAVLLAVAAVLAAAMTCASADAMTGAPAVAITGRPAAVLVGGVSFGYLPVGLGDPSAFGYEFDGVRFGARTWESRRDDGWRVDLDVVVMHGARLRTEAALHDWFVDYEQRPPQDCTYRPTHVRSAPAWRCADQVFWLVRPGLAVSVLLDVSRAPGRDLVRIARSAREVPGVISW